MAQVLGPLTSALKGLYERIVAVKANKARAQDLYEIIVAVKTSLSSLSEDQQLAPHVRAAMAPLERCIADVCAHLDRANSAADANLVERVWSSAAIDEEWRELYWRIATSVAACQFSVSVYHQMSIQDLILQPRAVTADPLAVQNLAVMPMAAVLLQAAFTSKHPIEVTLRLGSSNPISHEMRATQNRFHTLLIPPSDNGAIVFNVKAICAWKWWRSGRITLKANEVAIITVRYDDYHKAVQGTIEFVEDGLCSSESVLRVKARAEELRTSAEEQGMQDQFRSEQWCHRTTSHCILQ